MSDMTNEQNQELRRQMTELREQIAEIRANMLTRGDVYQVFATLFGLMVVCIGVTLIVLDNFRAF